MHIVATDLDRTLLPNGIQKYDGSMGIFKEIVKRKPIVLVYASGRNLSLLNKAIRRYKAPLPDYAVCDVGTKIYKKRRNDLIEDKGWIKRISKKTRNWNIKKFKKVLSDIDGLKMQEPFRQNQFKLSYYIPRTKNYYRIIKEVEKRIKRACKNAVIVYSVDETRNMGLLDILPKYATKLAGIEYLRKKLNLTKNKVFYCGDSGNDSLPLTYGYKAILVKNAIPAVKKEVKSILRKKNKLNRLYIAKGKNNLNGYYVSGIIEGLVEFGIVRKS